MNEKIYLEFVRGFKFFMGTPQNLNKIYTKLNFLVIFLILKGSAPENFIKNLKKILFLVFVFFMGYGFFMGYLSTNR